MSLSNRGGHHTHAERWGRKSSWKNPTPTHTIRVPEGLTEQILAYAHIIDDDASYDYRVILDALDRFIESEQYIAKGNQHKRKGETVDINTSRDWTKLREFRLWVQSQIQELE